jgi:hypothetical protein
MTYRLTKKAAQTRLEAMRRGRERALLEGPAPDYPAALPELRRRIVVESFDFGHEIHVLEFFRSDRADCFRVMVDGKEWKRRIGFSKALAGLRKSMPRVGAP